jgi:hypothetical protein
VVRAAWSGVVGRGSVSAGALFCTNASCIARMLGSHIASARAGWLERRLRGPSGCDENGVALASTTIVPTVGSGEDAVDAARREASVRRFVDEVWNARNYEAAAELYGESYVSPFGTGPAARVEPIRRYPRLFPTWSSMSKR